MNRSDVIAPEYDVVRYVGGSHIDGNTGQIAAGAFERALKDHDGMSFTQCGILAADDQAKDESLIRTIVGSRIGFGKKAVFAQLNVGEGLVALAAKFDDEFSFVHDPLAGQNCALANPAHCLLLGLPFKGASIGSLRSELAGDVLAKAVKRIFPAIAG